MHICAVQEHHVTTAPELLESQRFRAPFKGGGGVQPTPPPPRGAEVLEAPKTRKKIWPNVLKGGGYKGRTRGWCGTPTPPPHPSGADLLKGALGADIHAGTRGGLALHTVDSRITEDNGSAMHCCSGGCGVLATGARQPSIISHHACILVPRRVCVVAGHRDWIALRSDRGLS